MVWSQNYDPFNNLAVSASLAALPVVLLLVLLGLCHWRAHWAALMGLFSALLVAVVIFQMPVDLALGSALYGAAYGIFPIGWIVVMAIFLYEVSVVTGQFDLLRSAIAKIADDCRIQALLIAFSFGAFIEGAAGFGTPVAISAAMLIGLRFKPLHAAGLALIGNTAPVAFGALGTPILMLAEVTKLPVEDLSQMVGRQLPFFSLIVPFWLVCAMVGWREMLRVWPACLVAGGSFASVQFLVSNLHGPWLVDIAGSLASILSMVILLRIWKPAPLPIALTEKLTVAKPQGSNAEPTVASPMPSTSALLRAMLPWILLMVMVSLWGTPAIKKQLDRATFLIPIPLLHEKIVRGPPILASPAPEKVEFKANLLSATGTALLIAGVLSSFLLGLHLRQIASLLGRTLQRTALSLVTIAAMLSLGYTTRLSGLDATMGLAFASTGFLFPFFSPLLGWLGVALTGSDTSSNILFGNLQQITAERLGLSPTLAAAANSSGGVMGKMIDAQSIVVASVATGQKGEEGAILRYVFLHSLALAVLVGLYVAGQAWMMRS